MTTELVILSNIPAMSLCEICPKPGHCCSNFFLRQDGQAFTAWKTSWQEDAQAFLDERGLPFTPDLLDQETEGDEGIYGVPIFSCVHLQNGRCSIYSDRPNVCRIFIPAASSLCVMYAEEPRDER